MKTITNQTRTLYKYDGKYYQVSNKDKLDIMDIIIDGRDYNFKLIESNHDIFDMSFVAPELYCILEEVTIQD